MKFKNQSIIIKNIYFHNFLPINLTVKLSSLNTGAPWVGINAIVIVISLK